MTQARATLLLIVALSKQQSGRGGESGAPTAMGATGAVEHPATDRAMRVTSAVRRPLRVRPREEAERVDVSANRGRSQPLVGQFEIEGRGGHTVIFPADCASWIVIEPLEWEAGLSAEHLLGPPGSLRVVDQSVRLVEPDREARPDMGDERRHRARLGFRGGAAAGVVAAVGV